MANGTEYSAPSRIKGAGLEMAPTDDKLKADAIKFAEYCAGLWDKDEVDFCVISSRRDGTLNFQWAGTFVEHERLVRVLQEIIKRQPVNVKGK